MEKLTVTSPSFVDGGDIPREHTGFGKDISPAFDLQGLGKETVSVAIIMVDLDIPFMKEYPHWLIWNLPPDSHIPSDIPHGAKLQGGAVQGVAYGKNCYRGPKPPFFERKAHRYVFHIYALDCRLTLDGNANRKALLNAMHGHILRQGSIMGQCKR